MKKILSVFLVMVMLLTLAPMNMFAEDTTAGYVDDIYNMSPEEYAQWKQNYIASQSADTTSEGGMSLFDLNGGYIRNDYIEAYIRSDGHYTMGTTGGNPGDTADNNKLLLFGHPNSTTTETLIRINGSDYFFNSNGSEISADGKKCVSTMTIGGVVVTQTISLVHNIYTNREDIVEIKYDLKNNSSETKQLGGRIMLDTMLGNNDGAPFKIPNIGEVTTEREFSGASIPQYWQSFDSLSNPKVVSSGTFYQSLASRPDKVQFAAWPGIVGSSWNYSVNINRSVTNDSAVAAYYNPVAVASGSTRSFSTYYGLSSLSVVDSIGELTYGLTGETTIALQKNAEGTAYANNPITIEAHLSNNSNQSKTVQMSLTNPSEAVLVSGQQSRTISIPSGQNTSVAWQLWIKPQATAKTLYCPVTFQVDGEQKTETKTIIAPAVSYYNVSGLTLSKSRLTMPKGKTEKLIAYLNTPAGRQEAQKYEVRWTSSKPSVAKVDADGNVKAVGNGYATITAYTADYKMHKSCTVNVISRPTTELDLWGLSGIVYKNLKKGKSFDEIFKEKTPGDNSGLYKSTTKFYSQTITKNEFYRNNMSGFVVDDVSNVASSGFYAASFTDCNDGIVIAFRGTEDGEDVSTDIDFVMDKLSSQFDDAMAFYQRVRNKHSSKKIWLTGHSLGGALATYVSIITGEEAITFNGAQGYIIDLTYAQHMDSIANFNGIDNWNFINHYNKSDELIGAWNASIYHSVGHNSNNKWNIEGTASDLIPNHKLLTLLKTDQDGNISLTGGVNNYGEYYASPWIRTLNDDSRGATRVLLGTEGDYLKKLTAPGNWIEIRDNVFFSGGNTEMTGNGSAPDTFIFKSGDTMYGKGDDDTYITYETGGFFAEISDSSGDDKIIFKNMAMSELSLGSDDDQRYRINTGNGYQVWVDKHRGWRQPEIIVVDKYGVEKKISELGSNGSGRTFSLMDVDEAEEGKITRVFVEGRNVSLDIMDAQKNVLGTYSNVNSEVITTEKAYIYTSNAAGSESIEIELLDPNLYVRINEGENVKLSVLYGAVDEADSEVFTADVDLITNEAALINGNAEATDKFVYINGDAETPMAVTELAKVSAIIPTMAPSATTFALRTATVDNIDIYAGETADVELSFEPANIALDDVRVELLNDNDIVSVLTEDNKITVKGNSAGTNTLKITALDGSGTTISIPVTVRQDAMGDVVLTSNGSAYTENTWSDYPVIIAATAPAGYDTIVYQVEGDVYQTTESITVDSQGETIVKVYAKNSESGRITETKSYALKIDLSAPTLEGIENGGVYYIDKLIDASDINIDTISINGTEFTSDEYINGKWINTVGNYTIVASDVSGKSTEVTIEFKALPEVDELTLGDEELVVSIRNSFEDVKYDLPEDRRELLDSAIYELENRISCLKNPDNASNSILAFAVEGQIGEVYIHEDSSTVHVEMTPEAIATEKTVMVSISDGATISPRPYEAQNFSNTVTYTVRAANGTERQWTIAATVPNDTTAPQIVSASAENNIITIEFDDHIGGIANESGFALTKQSGIVSNNAINNISYYENMVTIEFSNSFDEMEKGNYILSIAANSLSNISNVGNEALSYTFALGGIEKVATPTTNVIGQIYRGAQVTLTTTTEGATIYYTVDGTIPTTASAVYSTPITINAALTIKAIAVKGGMLDSDMLTAAYTIIPEQTGGGGGGGPVAVAKPKVDNSNKEVVKGTAITLSTKTKDAKIYYTLDGSKPTTESTLYTQPIVLNENTTIKMIAVKEKMADSSIVTVEFTVRNARVEPKKDVEKIPYMVLRENGKFMPDESATRYEIITALAELFDIEKTDVVKQFEDVDSKNNDLVSLFAGASIIDGYPDGTFGGEKGITRAEFVKILTVMLNLDETVEEANALGDIEGHWAKDYILRFVKQGYVKGYPDNTFRPDNNITRAEVVTIINRIIEAADKDVAVSEDVSSDHWAYSEIKKAMIGKEE